MLSNCRKLESVFELLPSSSSWNEEGLRPPPAVKEKSCGSSGCASFTTTILPRFWLTNVQVTVSPLDTSMVDTGDPSEQVADDSTQPDGVFSATEWPEPGATTKRLDAGSSLDEPPSLSSWKLVSTPPPPVKSKSCGSSGCASLTTMI